MIIVVANDIRDDTNGLLDLEGIEGIGLVIKKDPLDPDEFSFYDDVQGSNLDISPSGLSVFIEPLADRSGTFRIGLSGGVFSLTEEL